MICSLKANDLVLIDPKIILHSPREMMIAGIGDTLAKWYKSHNHLSVNDKPIEVQERNLQRYDAAKSL